MRLAFPHLFGAGTSEPSDVPAPGLEASFCPQIKQLTALSLCLVLSGHSVHVHLCLACAGNGTPLQSSCLENPTDGGAWWAAVHGVTKSRTRLSDFTSLQDWRLYRITNGGWIGVKTVGGASFVCFGEFLFAWIFKIHLREEQSPSTHAKLGVRGFFC